MRFIVDETPYLRVGELVENGWFFGATLFGATLFGAPLVGAGRCALKTSTIKRKDFKSREVRGGIDSHGTSDSNPYPPSIGTALNDGCSSGLSGREVFWD